MSSPLFPAADMYVAGYRMLTFVREAGVNDGIAVRAIQGATGNKPPDAWCASTAAYVGKTLFGSRWPVPKSASCDDLLRWFRKEGLLFIPERTWVKWGSKPDDAKLIGPVRRGDLFFKMKSPTDATHVGVASEIREDGSFATIEGNAADPSKPSSVDGNGIYEGRIRNHAKDPYYYAFGHWPGAMK